jgi:ribosomal protein S18 acetylase RimI-like enzyme
MQQQGGGQPAITIVRATRDHLDDLVPLFEGYRAFYGHAPAPERAREFLAERLTTGDTVIFLATLQQPGAQAVPAGFTHLFPSFTTGGMRRIWILNDLFVAPDARRYGVGRRLLEHTRDFGCETGAARLTLETQVTNHAAQALYESLGWVRDTQFYMYELAV